MKTITLSKTLFIFFLLISSHILTGQDKDSTFKKPYQSQTYFVLGAGTSLLRNVPSNFYQDGHSNMQIGLMKEFPFNKKLSFIAGLELERLIYNLDFFPVLQDDGNTFVQAPSGVKYTRLFQSSMNLSIQTRFYFRENNSRNAPNIFVQTGLRGGYNLSSVMTYRENDQDESINLSEIVSPFNFQIELMLGFKGDFFKKLDILNASAFGLTYQVGNVLDAGNVDQVKPIHLTWRFLF